MTLNQGNSEPQTNNIPTFNTPFLSNLRSVPYGIIICLKMIMDLLASVRMAISRQRKWFSYHNNEIYRSPALLTQNIKISAFSKNSTSAIPYPMIMNIEIQSKRVRRECITILSTSSRSSGQDITHTNWFERSHTKPSSSFP